MTSWTEAIGRYRKHTHDQARREEEILCATIQLGNLLNNSPVISLLNASNRFIRLAETSDGNHTTVYILNGDGKGTYRSDEQSGSSAAYSADAQKPVLTLLELSEFVTGIAACETQHASLEELALYVSRELDKIADAAPKD